MQVPVKMPIVQRQPNELFRHEYQSTWLPKQSLILAFVAVLLSSLSMVVAVVAILLFMILQTLLPGNCHWLLLIVSFQLTNDQNLFCCRQFCLQIPCSCKCQLLQLAPQLMIIVGQEQKLLFKELESLTAKAQLHQASHTLDFNRLLNPCFL